VKEYKVFWPNPKGWPPIYTNLVDWFVAYWIEGKPEMDIPRVILKHFYKSTRQSLLASRTIKTCISTNSYFRIHGRSDDSNNNTVWL